MKNQFVLWNGDIAVMGKPSGNGTLLPDCHILILSGDTHNLTKNTLLAVKLRKSELIQGTFTVKNHNAFLVNKDSIMYKVGAMDPKTVQEVSQKILVGLQKAL